MLHHFEVVDEDCIGCGLCLERAPGNIEIPDGSDTARVFKQPETPAEMEACLEASDYCPLGGLRPGTPDLSPADSSAGDTRAPSIPAGDATPGELIPTNLEI
ncbi:MAG: ferredoxin [Gammaproteobacteria bacterium]|jgi:ferredoxin|nr:ferredoxin [Gammaproteobacteria bacterium]MBP6051560.1 ferredoxin [Pseudomonadales bacterium]MBK6581325.1 ferredoxin [Gammaproteobacteria bacterium]MBK7167864.1 ferredoxin [Gammaproteobacteria bacterium]MBK7518722.1 ferredoxin [Gammaproteobacteria bacterium]